MSLAFRTLAAILVVLSLLALLSPDVDANTRRVCSSILLVGGIVVIAIGIK